MTESAKEKYKEYLNTSEGVEAYNKFKEIMYDNPDSLITRLFDYVSPQIKNKKLNILDVGGGDAKRLKFLMRLLEAIGVSSKATVVEQSEAFINDLKSSLSDHKLGYEIKPIHSTFEDYQSKEKFDLILFIHSIYSFNDTLYLEKTKKLLKDGGSAIFVVNDKNSFLAGLKDILDDSFAVKRKNIESLRKEISEEGFVVKVKTSSTSFNNCLRDDKFTDDSRLIVSWIAMKEFDQIAKEQADKSLKYIIDRSTADGRLEEGEVFLFVTVKK